LIGLTPKAERQVDELRRHYEDRERIEALYALLAAVDEAKQRIESNPAAGLAAPRPYAQLANPGRSWIKVGRYWVAYSTTRPLVIVGVYYDMADIPRRM
jgi:hypothetical protein